MVIIGVIAAITVPSLINKYHDQQLTTQFKKAFSSMSNAINKTNAIDFSGQADCYYGNDGLSTNIQDCRNFYKTLEKNLNISRICRGQAKSKGCVPTYSSYPTNSGCTGFSQADINGANTVYVLSDGQIIIPYANITHPIFLIDINGFQGPNKYGYDLFAFSISKIVLVPIPEIRMVSTLSLPVNTFKPLPRRKSILPSSLLALIFFSPCFKAPLLMSDTIIESRILSLISSISNKA